MALFRCVECNRHWEFDIPEIHLCTCSHPMKVTKEMIRAQHKRELILGLSMRMGTIAEDLVEKVLDEIEELELFGDEGLEVTAPLAQAWARIEHQNGSPESLGQYAGVT